MNEVFTFIHLQLRLADQTWSTELCNNNNCHVYRSRKLLLTLVFYGSLFREITGSIMQITCKHACMHRSAVLRTTLFYCGKVRISTPVKFKSLLWPTLNFSRLIMSTLSPKESSLVKIRLLDLSFSSGHSQITLLNALSLQRHVLVQGSICHGPHV